MHRCRPRESRRLLQTLVAFQKHPSPKPSVHLLATALHVPPNAIVMPWPICRQDRLLRALRALRTVSPATLEAIVHDATRAARRAPRRAAAAFGVMILT